MSDLSIPDETERVKINLEDDVRSFLIGRLAGNQMPTQKKVTLKGMGVNFRRLCRPSYIAVNSGCDSDPDESARGCHIGAEGVMVHEDEQVVHLAFKCGNADHKMHYTTFMPDTIAEMAKAMEAVWPGSISQGIVDYAFQTGRLSPSFEENVEPFDGFDDTDEIDDAGLDDFDWDE